MNRERVAEKYSIWTYENKHDTFAVTYLMSYDNIIHNDINYILKKKQLL